ncbi:MAG: PEP-CTERM sorting domain-containing protein [Caulobacteraceae bacterium]|nr:PEP-CTERM sorting domain-containing protein [Caulobacteraceae bacterium]
MNMFSMRQGARARRPQGSSWMVGASVAVLALAFGSQASAASIFTGNLVVSSLTYVGDASTVTNGQALPNCTGGSCVTAIANGSYGQVFQNDTVDANFGVTAPYALQFFSAKGTTATYTSTYAIPNATFTGSFSSKSEGAINVTPDGKSITMLGYNAAPNQIDISNSNTPGGTETGNTDVAKPTYRTVAQVNANGTTSFTNTNAYSGNNGRAVILGGDGKYYMVGNAGNGNGDGNTAQITGVQTITPGSPSPNTSQIGKVNAAAYGVTDKKPAKDNNFRGETVFNNTLYVTKGSGSNGIDTVYEVGQIGTVNASTNIAVLPGFPTDAAKTNTANFYPFGIWFANSTTLYVADEGDGVLGHAASDGNAGLEKWSLVGGTWVKDYTLQLGLNLGQNYTVTGTDAAGETGSYTTATDGLRNIIGKLNADGTVTIYAVTSTASDGTGDQGADPDKLVAINDLLANTDPNGAAGESFVTLETAAYGQVLRGVALVTPVPEPATWTMMMLGLFGLGGALRARRKSAVATA